MSVGDHPLTRRKAITLGAIGSAMAFGQPLFIATGQAADKPSSTGAHLWKARVDITGAAVISANVCSVAVDDLDLSGDPQTNPVARARIRVAAAAGVHDEIRKWFDGARDPKQPLRTVKILLQSTTGARTYQFADTFPTSYTKIDFTTQAGGACMAWEIEIRVGRVEMA